MSFAVGILEFRSGYIVYFIPPSCHCSSNVPLSNGVHCQTCAEIRQLQSSSVDSSTFQLVECPWQLVTEENFISAFCNLIPWFRFHTWSLASISLCAGPIFICTVLAVNLSCVVLRIWDILFFVFSFVFSLTKNHITVR
jgi:hypothetical protein